MTTRWQHRFLGYSDRTKESGDACCVAHIPATQTQESACRTTSCRTTSCPLPPSSLPLLPHANDYGISSYSHRFDHHQQRKTGSLLLHQSPSGFGATKHKSHRHVTRLVVCRSFAHWRTHIQGSPAVSYWGVLERPFTARQRNSPPHVADADTNGPKRPTLTKQTSGTSSNRASVLPAGRPGRRRTTRQEREYH